MKFIENFAPWISQEWIDHVSANKGLEQNGNLNQEVEIPFGGFTWELFDRHNTSFRISPPMDFGTHKWEWWIKKLLPGDGFPVVRLTESTRRLWMPLTDYELGHIFIWGEEMVAPYNKGDLYEFEENSPYAAVNLSTHPFYLMMFSCSKEPQWDSGFVAP